MEEKRPWSDLITGQQGVHGRSLDHCMSARQRAVKGTGQMEEERKRKASLYVGVTK